MADDEVTTEFVADAERYIGPVEEMKEAVDGLRDALLEAKHETAGLRDDLATMTAATDANTASLDELRDKLAEVALAADAAKHEIDGVRDAEVEAAAAGGAEGGGGIFSTLGEAISSAWEIAGKVLIAIAVVAIPAIVTELAGLVAGFTAAGLGLGAFALLAVHGLDQIKTGYTNVTTAQQAYHAAVLKEREDPTAANAKAVSSALEKLKLAWDGLSPAARKGVEGIDQLKAAYDKMATAFTPDAMKVFDDGLKIANNLLPQIKPFADTAATSLDRMLKSLAGYFEPAQRAIPVTENLSSAAQRLGISVQTQLTPWQQFMAYMHGLEGPALSAIGQGLGNVGQNLLKLLQVMSKKDVINSINIAFRILSGTIHAITDTVRWSMDAWDDLGRAIDWTRRHIDDWSRDVRSQFDEVVSDVKHAVDAFDRFRDDVIRAVEEAGQAVIRFAESMSMGLLEWISRTVTDVNARWDQGWSAVVSFARSVPGKILSALGSLGGLLVSAGASLIRGLISGIQSAIPGLEGILSFVRGIVSAISGLFSSAAGAKAGAGAIRGGGVHGAIAGLAGPAPGPAPASAAAGPQAVHVTVSLANVMSTPRAQQALAAHVQDAIGDFASRAGGSFLVLPGKSAGR